MKTYTLTMELCEAAIADSRVAALDPYTLMACRLFNITAGQVTRETRQNIKKMHYYLHYGRKF